MSRSTRLLPVAFAATGMLLSACGSSHHTVNSVTTMAPTTASSSAIAPAPSSTSTTPSSASAAPTSTSTSSSSDSMGSMDAMSSGQAMQDAVRNGNAGNAAGQMSVAATGSPRGGVGAAPNTQNAEAQVNNFLKTLFSYDTSIDTSESGAAARASQYASGALASSLHELIAPSAQFADATKHHGYTTVQLSPTTLGDTNISSRVANICEAVTTTWHGDSGWKAPAPTTETWCAAAENSSSTNGWQITHVSDAGAGK